MTKRLQLTLSDHAYREILRESRSRHISVEEWIRSELKLALRREFEIYKKLQAVRAAVKHEFPTRDIDDMLKEIESARKF